MPHVRFQVPFLGPESQLKSGFACADFQIYMLFAKINAIVFLLICDFAVLFLVPPDGPENGTVKMLFFCSFIKLWMRSQNGTARQSHFWDRV